MFEFWKQFFLVIGGMVFGCFIVLVILTVTPALAKTIRGRRYSVTYDVGERVKYFWRRVKAERFMFEFRRNYPEYDIRLRRGAESITFIRGYRWLKDNGFTKSQAVSGQPYWISASTTLTSYARSAPSSAMFGPTSSLEKKKDGSIDPFVWPTVIDGGLSFGGEAGGSPSGCDPGGGDFGGGGASGDF